MSDTARDYQTIEPASTEGLDSIFDATPTDADSLVEVAQASADSLSWVTVTQAAAALGKSERTIQRYIKANKLQAREDLNGKFLVVLPTGAHTNASVPTDADCPARLVVADADTVELSPTDADGLGSLVATNADDFQSPADNRKPVAVTMIPASELDGHLTLIKELQAQVQAAAFRNGYLESKLEERDREIKLLTDSQHKQGWWVRFSSWFFKGK
jgi:hypothetical protein